MLGSSNENERAVAGKMIADAAEAAGKTIADFVMAPPTISERATARQPRGESFEQHRARRARSGRGVILAAIRDLQDEPWLSAWESDFIESILMKVSHDIYLTPAQERTCQKIIRKGSAYEDDPLV